MGAVPGVGVVGEVRSASYQRGQIFNRLLSSNKLWLIFEILFESRVLPFMTGAKEYKIDGGFQYAPWVPIFEEIGDLSNPSSIGGGQLFPMPGANQIVVEDGNSIADLIGKVSKSSDRLYRVGWQLAELQQGILYPTARIRLNSSRAVFDSQVSGVAVPPLPHADATKVKAFLTNGFEGPQVSDLGNTRIEQFWSVGASASALNNLFACQYVSSCFFDLDLINPANSGGFRRDQNVGGALSGQAFRAITPGLCYNSQGQIS